MSYKDEEKIDAWASLLQVGTSNQDQPIGSQADSLRISQRYQQCVAFTSPDKYIYTEHQQQAYYSLLADLDVRWGSDLKHQEEIFMKRNDKGPSVDDLFDVFFRKPMDPKPRDHKPSDSDHVPSLDYQLTQSEQAINDRRQENVYGPCDNSISKIQPGSIQLQQIPSQDSFTSTNNHLPSLLESGSSFASNNVSEMSYMPAIGTTSHHHIPSMTRFTSFIPSSDSCEHYRTKSILQNSDQQTINEPCVMVCKLQKHFFTNVAKIPVTKLYAK